LLGGVLFLVVIGAALALLTRMPSGLVPQEDQGVALVVAQLPPSASLPRTEAVRDQLVHQLLGMEEISDITAIAGFDIVAGSLRTNAAVGFASLSDWDERRGPGQDVAAIAERIMALGFGVQEANVFAFTPPPIMGLSLTGGVEGFLQVRGGPTLAQVEEQAQRFVAAVSARPEVASIRTTLDTGIPQYRAEVDREQAAAIGV